MANISDTKYILKHKRWLKDTQGWEHVYINQSMSKSERMVSGKYRWLARRLSPRGQTKFVRSGTYQDVSTSTYLN